MSSNQREDPSLGGYHDEEATASSASEHEDTQGSTSSPDDRIAAQTIQTDNRLLAAVAVASRHNDPRDFRWDAIARTMSETCGFTVTPGQCRAQFGGIIGEMGFTLPPLQPAQPVQTVTPTGFMQSRGPNPGTNSITHAINGGLPNGVLPNGDSRSGNLPDRVGNPTTSTTPSDPTAAPDPTSDADTGNEGDVESRANPEDSAWTGEETEENE